MLQPTEKELQFRLAFGNPWWEEGGGVDEETVNWPRRAYFEPFMELVTATDVRRAVVLMGPRQVGKTVMIRHTIHRLLQDGIEPDHIFFVSIDNPALTGCSLEKLLHLFQDMRGHKRRAKGLYVFFDEVQYLKDWEVHLKSLVDSYPGVRFIVSGSAAAALKMKSRESGAGRFTEFLLPPLTFAEFLLFRGIGDDPTEIDRLNDEFVAYVNFGGFPEPVISERVRAEMGRYVASDIIDKVLLRDLPSLYGIGDPRELNQLFSVLAFNTGMEVNLDGLSKASGVAKNTIRKYLEYLEAAFLIHRVERIDQNARRFKRATAFKVYLTNPSLRAALFGPVGADDAAMGPLAETAVFAQEAHSSRLASIYYARWSAGEVDYVLVSPKGGKPHSAIEIKWSDGVVDRRRDVRSLVQFAKATEPTTVGILTRRVSTKKDIDGVPVVFVPVALYCRLCGGLLEMNLREGINPQTLLPYGTD